MEIIDYLRIFRRWLWLIVLAAIIGGGINFYFQREAQTLYVAQSKVLIGRYVTDPDPSSSEIRLAQDLLLVYMQILQRTDVLQAVILKLDLDISVFQLRQSVSASQVGDTSILGINVVDTDAQKAIDVANELANQLIENSPSTLTQDQQDRIDLAFDQIEELRVLQEDTQRQIDLIDDAIAESDSSDNVFSLSDRRSTLLSQYSEISATIADFSSLITALEDPINSIQMFELASSVAIAQRPNPIMAILVGAATAAVIIGTLVLIREYANTNIREVGQASEVLEIPLVGECSKHGNRFNRGKRKLIFDYDSSLLLLEEFRALRANLTAMTTDRDQQLFVVTSTYEQEGKSWVSANLAISLAMAGHRVCLVDADLRRPTLHKMFKIDDTEIDSNDDTQEPDIASIYRPSSLKFPREEHKKSGTGLIGLAHALGGQHRDPSKKVSEIDWDSSLFWTGMEDLWLVTSGFNALNSNEILGSPKMCEYVDWLVKEKHFDFVILDSPPLFYVSDCTVLASNINANVLFVMKKNRVPENVAESMMGRLKQSRVDPIGFVFNFSQSKSNLYYTKPPRIN